VKRDSFGIIAEILELAKHGAKKTHITYQCNLSYGQTRDYLTYLLDVGFVGKGGSFHTTEKGLEFLKAYKTLEHLMNTKTSRK
jgi:predicted transcriptional regulator